MRKLLAFTKSSVFGDRKRRFNVGGRPFRRKKKLRFLIYPGKCGRSLKQKPTTFVGVCSCKHFTKDGIQSNNM